MIRAGLAALVFALALACVLAIGAGAAMPRLYKNCANLNKRYPHGVGRLHAKDHTSGVPVTSFKRSTTLYNTAIGYNRGLDRDKDGIACESE